MDKAPNLFHLRNLLESATTVSACIDGEWVPARPMGWSDIPSRLKFAWMVFTGKADAVIWPKGQ